MRNLWEKKWIRKCTVIAFWLLMWQLLALVVNNSILLAGPIEVLLYLQQNMVTFVFWNTVLFSCARIVSGFLLALVLAVVMAVICAKKTVISEFFSPLVQFMKAVPVASVVVLLLLFSGSARLSLYITVFMAFPILFQNILTGIQNTDKDMLEMAKVFEMPLINKIKFLYVPYVMPFLVSSCKTALGMSWKAGVAAEVIGIPDFSIGERIYMSKIYLETEGLFAWTVLVVLLSVLFERSFIALLGLGQKRLKCTFRKKDADEQERNFESKLICLSGIKKSFGDKTVFDGLNVTFEPGEICCIMGPSGSGKTTLLRLLSKLEKPEEGAVEKTDKKIAVVFQEERLCPEETALTNIAIACGKTISKEEAERALCAVLPKEELTKKVSQFSGGMKRRVAIVRALLSDAPYIVMDEPFAGLDEETKKEVAQCISRYRSGRTLLVATHNEQDAKLLQARIMYINGEKTR